MSALTQLWQQLVDAICRPPRDEYSLRELLGGTGRHFVIGRCAGKREDFQLVNTRGKKLECSRFLNVSTPANRPVPTVIYLHCNSGSRRDAEEAVYRLLPDGIAVVCLDFEGSGLSEGDHVTLGAHEVDDVQIVIEHLRSKDMASIIGLWGRSMGAVTALLCSERDPSIAGIVCDSPFSRLKDLMLELVEDQNLPIPRFLYKTVLGFMRRSVRNRAGFDIYEVFGRVSPLDKVKEAFVPALFGHAEDDNFVLKHHSEALHEQYAGEKNLIMFEGDHNSLRPTFFYTSVVIFFINVLQVDRSGGPSAAAASAQNAAQLFGPDTAALLAARGDIPGDDDQQQQPSSPHAAQQLNQSSWWGADRTNGAAAAIEELRNSGADGSDDDENNPVLQEVLRLSLVEQRPQAEADSSPPEPQPRVTTASGDWGTGGADTDSGPAGAAQDQSAAVPSGLDTGASFEATSSLRDMLPASQAAEDAMLEQAIAASLAASAPAPAPSSTDAFAASPESTPSADHERQPRKAFPTDNGSEPASISAEPVGASMEQRVEADEQSEEVLSPSGRGSTATVQKTEEDELEALRAEASMAAWPAGPDSSARG